MSFLAERREVLATCLQLAEKGFLAGTSGNIACRAGASHFAITPSASDYYAMTPEDICVVRLDDLTCIFGNRRPSVELRLHAAVFRKHEDCNASLHTHQPIASAYSLLGKDLIPQIPSHRQVLGKIVPCLGYAPSGTTWLANRLLKRLSTDTHAYLMRNHGVICCGSSVPQAVERLEALESSCGLFFSNAMSKRSLAEPRPWHADVQYLLSHNDGQESLQ